jgi:hypothetical protein
VHADPLVSLSDLNVITAWTQRMPKTLLWLPDQRIMVLNASVPRETLAEHVTQALAGRYAPSSE